MANRKEEASKATVNREVACLKGNPYDNARMESFFKTLKQEEVYIYEYCNFQEAKERIVYFLEVVYNQKRLHSALGYLPPTEFEALSTNPKAMYLFSPSCV